MRDIRPDLKERLSDLDARMSTLVAEYNRRKNELDKEFSAHEADLNDERQAASALLQIERRRHGEVTSTSLPNLTIGLADFLVREAAKRGPIPKEELRASAVLAGYFPEGESGGRAVHTTLLNLVRSGKIGETKDGLYFEPATLGFDNTESSEAEGVFS